MKIGMIALCGIGAIASSAGADFVGWTANVRTVTGGYLVNVFAVTDNSTDTILNVYGGGGGVGPVGSITTNSSGGFLQSSAGTPPFGSVFAPVGNQSWTDLDSFLTVGGSLNTTTGAWTANGSTLGDPAWNVSYTITGTGAGAGSTVTVSSFSELSNTTGFTNANVNAIPATAGWFLAGSGSAARSLAGLENRLASSAGGAASGSFGMMVAQLFVAELSVEGGPVVINWMMGATIRRTDGSMSNGMYSMTVPAPGAVALVAIAGCLSSRRRRA